MHPSDQQPPKDNTPGQVSRGFIDNHSVITLCLIVAVVFAIWIDEPTGGVLGPETSAKVARVVGRLIVLLGVPSLIAFSVSRTSSRWIHAFAISFGIIFALMLGGYLLGR